MTISDPSGSVELLQSKNTAPPRVIEAAKDVAAKQMRHLGLSEAGLASILAGCMRRVFTTALPTYAVSLAGDGFPILIINPWFALQLGPVQGGFVIGHEMEHLVNRHLYIDKFLHQDPRWTLVTEATINNRLQRKLKNTQMNGLPELVDTTELMKLEEAARADTATDADRKAFDAALDVLLDACRDPQAHSQLPKEKERSGVDPKKVYEMYSSDLRKQTPAKEPVSREDFYRTDLGCYAEICRMSKPPKMKASACVHASGQGDGDDKSDGKGGKEKGDGEGTFTVTLDQAETDKLVKDGIGVALREAHNGNRVLKDDLLDHMDASEGSESASKTWGEHAVGALRGETPKFRKIQFWDQWLFNKLGEKLVEGDRLVYLRKLWWDPSVRFRGDKPKKRGIIIVDTSGSMSQKVLDRVAERCGEEEGLEIEWACFDHDVYPFVPGEPFRGGGGTSFQICSDYVDDLEEQVDFVLMVTDGYAPQPEVKEPEKWVWLITPGGDSSWLESHPLFSNDFWELTEEDLA